MPIACSLVFAPAQFTYLQLNLFTLFRHFSFFTMVAEALQLGGFPTDDIPIVPLEFPEELACHLDVAKAWDTEELKTLALLALRVDRLARDGSLVAFVGGPHQIESAVEAALLTVPTLL